MDISSLFDPKNLEQAVVPTIIEYTPKILGLFLALIAAKLLSNWAGRLTKRALSKADEALQKFLSSMAKYTVLTIGVVTALGYVGVETASFAAIIAASGLAIGLAFQGTLSNFSAGVMLLIFRPFKVGDFIEGGGESGIVVEIELFTTELKSLDNKRIIVPNSKIFGANITNYTYHPIRRVDVSVGTTYMANIAETRSILETVPGKIQGVIQEPEPQIFLSDLGSSSVDWQIRVWCNTGDYWDVYQRTVDATKAVLDENKISIPFPQQDIHFDPEVINALKR